jgi:hypothetical protein
MLSYGMYPAPSHRFDMEKHEAMALTESPRMLVVARLSAPWYWSGTYFSDATYDHPYETHDQIESLQVVPVAIWIFNSKTGTVYGKFDLEEHK